MRIFLTLFLLVFIHPAVAKTWGPATAAPPGFDREAKLEEIFEKLARAQDAVEAQLVADKMWLIFMTAPDEQTAEDLNRALRARGGYNFKKAFKILSGVVERHPDFAEGWNQRSYIHFLRERYDESIADCANALKLEPRHVGCLSGMARILIRQQKNYVDGERFLDEAVRLHPFIYEKILYKEIPKKEL